MDKIIEKVLSTTVRRKVLEELIKNEKATAYEIAKNIDIPDAAVGRHLEILHQVGLVHKPQVDISEGRLKKIYSPTSEAERILREFWDREIRSAPKSIQNIYLRKECEEKGEE